VFVLTGCGAPPPPTLVLLISVDTLRADRLGAYGSERGLTPNLDALARKSAVFDAAYAPAAFTLPSVSALLTGRHPRELGIWKNESVVPEATPTLASELARRGWRTGAVVSNFVLRRASGLDAGFDRYDDTLPEREAVRGWPERTARATTDAALSMLEACTDAPCLLWVHYQDPHGPYTPPAALRARFLAIERDAPDGARELPVLDSHIGIGGIPSYQALDGRRDVGFYRAGYDAEVANVDGEIGRLLDALDERGLVERAVVVFVADHGESLGERDYWFSHGEYLSDVLVRVPLMIRAPGIAPGRRDDVASLIDVFPTLLSRLPDPVIDPALGGRDLFARDARQHASSPYLETLGAARERRFGLVDGEFKFVVTESDGRSTGRLTRRGRDEVDLVAAAPQIARQMRVRLEARRREIERGPPETRQELEAEARERLRALGYADDS
jgi:arylsulfatase